jgi:hypothetical protein
MNDLLLITWMQENTLMLMFIALCFIGLLAGLKALFFSRLKIDQPDDTRE